MRVGIGYDVHRLVAGRRLILGGVEIAWERGLEGWSDADVLLHAVIDALLGAAALGDIGLHFPPGDERYHDASSLHLLRQTGQRLHEEGWRIGNIDATIIAERPRLAPYVEAMRSCMGQALGLEASQISVKAKTTEGLGFTGRGEGIAAYAVALVEREKG